MNAPFGSHRLWRLMGQYTFCAICTILSLVLLAGIWVLWQDVHTNEALNRERSQEFESMLSTMVSGPMIRQELARAQDIVQRIDSNLVAESKLEENLRYFWRIQAKTQADILYLRPQPAEASSDGVEYKVIPFTIQLAGTYEQLAAFMLEIETGPKLAQIKTFSYRRREQSADSLSLSIDLKLLGKR